MNTNSNFFENELQRIFANSTTIEELRFTGRVAVGRLSDDLNVKLQFVTLGTSSHYEGIEATVLNRTQGKIDSTVFRFMDVIGAVTRNIGTPQQMFPYVWERGQKTEWYGYEPTPADYAKLLTAIDDYLEIFREPVQGMRQTQSM
jgi:hypothetical protein